VRLVQILFKQERGTGAAERTLGDLFCGEPWGDEGLRGAPIKFGRAPAGERPQGAGSHATRRHGAQGCAVQGSQRLMLRSLVL